MRLPALYLPLVYLALLPAAAWAETITLSRWAPSSLPPPKDPVELVKKVEAGALPAISERVPRVPLMVQETEARVLGKSGGKLQTMIGRQKDSRLMVVYGYARLVGYDEDYNLVPDILESVEIEDNRRFTLKLRPGHKWSDGHPFTSEDFRYYWEDVANHLALSPVGPPIQLVVDGKLPTVAFPDETTVIYAWDAPNPFFLPALAQASPLFIYRPAHYMKRFHERYADKEFLEQMVHEHGKPSWGALHNSLDNLNRMDNPDLPVLQPWLVVTPPPSQRLTAKRNAYFHRIDQAGMQLPYIDKWLLAITSPGLVPAKTAAGDSDLQARGIGFSDYPLLKEAQKREGYQVLLWKTVRPSNFALYPNLNANDPVWHRLNRDPRFRRALSLAIDRNEINQVIYFGLGLPGNQGPLPESPLYKASYRDNFAKFDLAEANRLLDEIGLTERDSEGLRLLPDGRPLEIIVESAGETEEEPDILELVKTTWRKAGIGLFTKPSDRTALRNRIFSGEANMVIWFGFENGVPTAAMSPENWVPIAQSGYHWPKWGQYHETKGQAGEPVDMPAAQELLDQFNTWRNAADKDTRTAAWNRILEINAEQVYTIGFVGQVPQPVVANKELKNLPKAGIYNWEPGAQFGIYRTDSFFFNH
ncbi:MAG: ABC transporter substrate-binding protein [Rhodospirillales bacterium]|nr:ABC transporter substrate-binding protein [Rhodospirillales bacterium]